MFATCFPWAKSAYAVAHAQNTFRATFPRAEDWISSGHSGAQTNCIDGAAPAAGLIQATSGDLYGTTSAGGANTASNGTGGTIFRLSLGLPPFVKTQPAIGVVGERVEIRGTDLTGATSVTFNGTPAAALTVEGTSIVTKVPAGATTGKVQVVTPKGTLTSNVAFEVVP